MPTIEGDAIVTELEQMRFRGSRARRRSVGSAKLSEMPQG
jgi:hypothetical protein